MDEYRNYKGAKEKGDEYVESIDNVEIFWKPNGKYKAIYLHEDGACAWWHDDLDSIHDARAAAYDDIAKIDEMISVDYRRMAEEERANAKRCSDG